MRDVRLSTLNMRRVLLVESYLGLLSHRLFLKNKWRLEMLMIPLDVKLEISDLQLRLILHLNISLATLRHYQLFLLLLLCQCLTKEVNEGICGYRLDLRFLNFFLDSLSHLSSGSLLQVFQSLFLCFFFLLALFFLFLLQALLLLLQSLLFFGLFPLCFFLLFLQPLTLLSFILLLLLRLSFLILRQLFLYLSLFLLFPSILFFFFLSLLLSSLLLLYQPLLDGSIFLANGLVVTIVLFNNAREITINRSCFINERNQFVQRFNLWRKHLTLLSNVFEVPLEMGWQMRC